MLAPASHKITRLPIMPLQCKEFVFWIGEGERRKRIGIIEVKGHYDNTYDYFTYDDNT
jgi:hypothetical protein